MNMLLEFVNSISRTNITIDFQSCYWHKQEDFLLLVTEAILHWLWQLEGVPTTSTAQQLLTAVKNNKPVYQLLYFLFHFGLFYWKVRQEIRKGNVETVTFAWKYCW